MPEKSLLRGCSHSVRLKTGYLGMVMLLINMLNLSAAYNVQ